MLVAHPSPDVYGSDLQLLQSIEAMRAEGAAVTVCLPSAGPLVPQLEKRGAEVRVLRFPVLRRELLRPRGLTALVLGLPATLFALVRTIRAVAPDVVYVNTVTIPFWLAAGRIARVPVLCHVHEAEESDPHLVRVGLGAPLLLAHRVVANSRASSRALTDVLPRLAQRITVVPNGVPDIERDPAVDVVAPGAPRIALVARLSPRKGVDVALEAVSILRRAGRTVELDVCGSVFPGYEWFEEQLRERAAQPDLAGAVHLLGYVSPTWPVLARCGVVLVPSRVEPFGNTAVEALLAGRPLVASGVQGLAEIVENEVTGLLVPPGDAAALAAAICRILDDRDLAKRLAVRGRAEALSRYSAQRYQRDITRTVDALRRAGAARETNAGKRRR